MANAAGELQTAVSAVPVDFQAANDVVVVVDKASTDTTEAVAEAKASLDAMVNAENILTGIADAGRAIAAGKAAFEAGQVLVSSVTDTASSVNDELRAAFDAAPGCQQDAT